MIGGRTRTNRANTTNTAVSGSPTDTASSSSLSPPSSFTENTLRRLKGLNKKNNSNNGHNDNTASSAAQSNSSNNRLSALFHGKPLMFQRSTTTTANSTTTATYSTHHRQEEEESAIMYDVDSYDSDAKEDAPSNKKAHIDSDSDDSDENDSYSSSDEMSGDENNVVEYEENQGGLMINTNNDANANSGSNNSNSNSNDSIIVQQQAHDDNDTDGPDVGDIVEDNHQSTTDETLLKNSSKDHSSKKSPSTRENNRRHKREASRSFSAENEVLTNNSHDPNDTHDNDDDQTNATNTSQKHRDDEEQGDDEWKQFQTISQFFANDLRSKSVTRQMNEYERYPSSNNVNTVGGDMWSQTPVRSSEMNNDKLSHVSLCKDMARLQPIIHQLLILLPSQTNSHDSKQRREETLQFSCYSMMSQPLQQHQQLIIIALTNLRLFVLDAYDTHNIIHQAPLRDLISITQCTHQPSIISIQYPNDKSSLCHILIQFIDHNNNTNVLKIYGGKTEESPTPLITLKYDFLDRVNYWYHVVYDNSKLLRMETVLNEQELKQREHGEKNQTCVLQFHHQYAIESSCQIHQSAPLCNLLSGFGDEYVLLSCVIQTYHQGKHSSETTQSRHVNDSDTFINEDEQPVDDESYHEKSTKNSMKKQQRWKKRYLILTDHALYIFKNISSVPTSISQCYHTMVKRRIPMEELGDLIRFNNQHRLLLIRVPVDEYDVLLKAHCPSIIDRLCHNLQLLFFPSSNEQQHGEENLVQYFDSLNQVLRFALLGKTKTHIQRNNLLKEYSSVIQLLRTAITQHDAITMKAMIQYANIIEEHSASNNNNSFKITDTQVAIKQTALKEIMKIKDQEKLKEEYSKALQNANIEAIEECSKRISQLKLVYEPLKSFLKQSLDHKNQLIKRAELLEHLRKLITSDDADQNEIETVFKETFSSMSSSSPSALQVKEIEQYQSFKKMHELHVQRRCMLKRLEEAKQNHDADRLLTIVECIKYMDQNINSLSPASWKQSDSTSKDNQTAVRSRSFEHVVANVQEFLHQKRVCNNLFDSIEEAKKTSKTSALDSLCKHYAEKYRDWITKTPAYITAIQIINIIKEFRVEIIKLKKAVDMLNMKRTELLQLTSIDDIWSQLEKRDPSEIVTKYLNRIQSSQDMKLHQIQLGKKDENIILKTNEALEQWKQTLDEFRVQKATHLYNELSALQSSDASKQDDGYESEEYESNDSVLELLFKQAKNYAKYHDDLSKLVSKMESKLDTKNELALLDQTQYNYSHFHHLRQLIINANKYELVTSDGMKQKLELILNEVSKQYEIYNTLHNALQSKDLRTVKKYVLEASGYEASMNDILNDAKLFLNKKKIEEISTKRNLEKAMASNDVSRIIELINLADEFPSLTPIVAKARSQVGGNRDEDTHSNISSLVSTSNPFETEINKFLSMEDEEGLSTYIADNEDTMPSKVLKQAKAELNKMRRKNHASQNVDNRHQSLTEMIENAIKTSNVKQLTIASDTIERLKLSASDESELDALYDLLNMAQGALHQIRSSNPHESKSYSVQQLEDMLRTGLLYKRSNNDTEKEASALIQRLIMNISQLRTSCLSLLQPQKQLQAPSIQSPHSKPKQLLSARTGDDLVRQLVVSIVDIISHKPKRRFFSASPSGFEIIRNLKRPEVVRLTDKFESLDIYSKVGTKLDKYAMSCLFVHFLLSENQLVHILNIMLVQEGHMREYFDSSSMLLNQAYREELIPYLQMLTMFHFEFVFTEASERKTSITLSHSPLSSLTSIVNAILQPELEDETHDRNQKNDSQRTSDLVRNELCDTLLQIVSHKFNSFGFFVRYDVWQMIEEVSEFRSISAIDVGGILLPPIVQQINATYPDAEPEDKFKYLVVHCVGEQCLLEVMITVFRDKSMWAKYYDMSDDKVLPLVVDDNAWYKVVDNLEGFCVPPLGKL